MRKFEHMRSGCGHHRAGSAVGDPLNRAPQPKAAAGHLRSPMMGKSTLKNNIYEQMDLQVSLPTLLSKPGLRRGKSRRSVWPVISATSAALPGGTKRYRYRCSLGLKTLGLEGYVDGGGGEGEEKSQPDSDTRE